MIDLNDVDFEIIAERVLERESDDNDRAIAWQGIVLAEEVGEFLQELRGYKGHSRHEVDNRSALTAELADVVITPAVMAALLGIDLNEAVNVKLAGIQNRGGI